MIMILFSLFRQLIHLRASHRIVLSLGVAFAVGAFYPLKSQPEVFLEVLGVSSFILNLINLLKP